MLCNRYPWKYSVIAAVGIELSYMVLLLLVNEPAVPRSKPSCLAAWTPGGYAGLIVKCCKISLGKKSLETGPKSTQ